MNEATNANMDAKGDKTFVAGLRNILIVMTASWLTLFRISTPHWGDGYNNGCLGVGKKRDAEEG